MHAQATKKKFFVKFEIYADALMNIETLLSKKHAWKKLLL